MLTPLAGSTQVCLAAEPALPAARAAIALQPLAAAARRFRRPASDGEIYGPPSETEPTRHDGAARGAEPDGDAAERDGGAGAPRAPSAAVARHAELAALLGSLSWQPPGAPGAGAGEQPGGPAGEAVLVVPEEEEAAVLAMLRHPPAMESPLLLAARAGAG